MSRYAGKVTDVLDQFTIVANIGSAQNVKLGDKFTVVGLGDWVTDPDTRIKIEQLEIYRGKVEVVHVQTRICTLKSYVLNRTSARRSSVGAGSGLAKLLYPETVDESLGLVSIEGAQRGDMLISMRTQS